MMLALELTAYLAVVFGTAGALFYAHRQQAWPYSRKAILWVLALVELAYMLRSPACVYLPEAPGPPAVRRRLLGVDGKHELHWTEGRSPVAFAWGLRGWFRSGHELFDFGAEIAPPLRYACLDHTRWEVVSAHRRQSHPDVVWTRELLQSDGTLVAWGGNQLLASAPDAAGWRVLSGLPVYPERLAAMALADDDSVVEVYLRDDVFEQTPQGTRRELTILRRDSAGRETSRRAVSLPAVTTERSIKHQLETAVYGDIVLVFELWWERGEGVGMTYAIDGQSAVRVWNTFPLVLNEFSPVHIAVTRDGAYFTTGQAVFRWTGERVRDIEPMLSDCRWDGHTLYGVRRYPFVVAHQRPAELPSRQRLYFDDDARARSRWILGGIDEAGREDEIVTIAL
jgi:hypothetical protein